MAKRAAKSSTRRRVLVALGLALLAGGAALALYGHRLSGQIEARFSGQRWDLPSRVYSDVTVIYPGQAMTRSQLLTKLQSLGYQQTTAAPRPGELRLRPKEVEIHLRQVDFPLLRREATRVNIGFDDSGVASLRRVAAGPAVALLELEPEELMQFFGTERETRQVVRLAEIPPELRHAVLAAEDSDFYRHHGVDVAGVLRALWVNLRHREVRQGGSTITQQLAKSYFLSPERTLVRKLKELLAALIIEATFDKDTILEIYLNEIYLGQRGSVAVHGVGEASRFYFGVPVARLGLDQAATLAGLIRGPNLYSPHQHPERARARRDQVLRRMQELGFIDQAALSPALAQEIHVAPFKPYERVAPFFYDYLSQQLTELYPAEVLATQGLSIFTTLDPQLQVAAEQALERGLQRLERSHPALKRDPEQPLQGAVVLMQPKTGHILAMVGGRDYGRSQFNRVTQAHRQPGSTFKPFVYLSGLERFGPAALLSNEPQSYPDQGRPWQPRNYDGQSGGQVRAREALARSLNLPTVDLAMKVGLPEVIATARRFGLSTALAPRPSLALGAFEVVPLELARAYCALAADGALPPALAVREIADSGGAVVHRERVRVQRATDPARAYLISDMLRSAVREGTGSGLARLGVTADVAGKTGTTDGTRDAWFIGYTPELLALVWVGFDDNRPVQAAGGAAALPIWADLAKAAPWGLSGRWPEPPPGVVRLEVCAESGALAAPECPGKLTELFLEQGAPTELCPLHRDSSPLGRAVDGVKRIFGL